MDPSLILGLVVASAVVFGSLGIYVAAQKGRSPGEGFVLGAIFGPLGCLIVALLPASARAPTSSAGAQSLDIDRAGQVAYLADRFRSILDETSPGW
jgi:hypothetical protein